LNKEIKRRTDVVGIFPTTAPSFAWWQCARRATRRMGRRPRYFSAESLSKLMTIDPPDPLPAPALLEEVA